MTSELPYVVTISDNRDRVVKMRACFLSLHDAKTAYKHFESLLGQHHNISLWDEDRKVFIVFKFQTIE